MCPEITVCFTIGLLGFTKRRESHFWNILAPLHQRLRWTLSLLSAPCRAGCTSSRGRSWPYAACWVRPCRPRSTMRRTQRDGVELVHLIPRDTHRDPSIMYLTAEKGAAGSGAEGSERIVKIMQGCTECLAVGPHSSGGALVVAPQASAALKAHCGACFLFPPSPSRSQESGCSMGSCAHDRVLPSSKTVQRIIKSRSSISRPLQSFTPSQTGLMVTCMP
jgi:hypothetical protein